MTIKVGDRVRHTTGWEGVVTREVDEDRVAVMFDTSHATAGAPSLVDRRDVKLVSTTDDRFTVVRIADGSDVVGDLSGTDLTFVRHGLCHHCKGHWVCRRCDSDHFTFEHAMEHHHRNHMDA